MIKSIETKSMIMKSVNQDLGLARRLFVTINKWILKFIWKQEILSRLCHAEGKQHWSSYINHQSSRFTAQPSLPKPFAPGQRANSAPE